MRFVEEDWNLSKLIMNAGRTVSEYRIQLFERDESYCMIRLKESNKS
jgi:hypothetical protein